MTTEHITRLEQIKALEQTLSPRQVLWKMRIWHLTIGLSRALKRALDIVGSGILVLLLAPLFALTSLLIYVEDPGPIFFSQIRVGKDGQPFLFWKFRSMIVDAERQKELLAAQNESRDGVIFKMKNDPRITRVGKVIRRFSIDELPQIYNVLRGNMSLVGPRPALPKEVAEYTPEQRKRLHVVPGITCLWQVNGRSDIPFTGQVCLDLEYIGSNSLKKDIIILAQTIPAVLSGKGAY